MFKLVIQDDEGKTTVVPLIRDEITIGRKEGNTIRLTERNVSRRHARILRNNGEVQIEDLGSYNGIRVNNARIAERVSLRVSDQVQIGDYKLYLKAEGVEQIDNAQTMPIERVDNALPTEVMAAQPGVATAPMAAQLPNRSPVSVADTDPQGRPVATAAQVAALQAPVGYGKLVVVSSNFAGKEFELTRPQMIIGRTDENDIVVNHRSISRNHAKVTRDPETGRYTISDLQSSNGVRVNGQDYGKVEMRRGDTVDLGHVRLRFVEPGEDFIFSRDAVIADVPEGGKKGLLVAIVLAVLVLGAVGLFFALKGKDEKPEVVQGTQTGSVGVGSNPIASNVKPPPEEPVEPAVVVPQPTGSDTQPAVKPAPTDDAGKKRSECESIAAERKWTEAKQCADALAANDKEAAKLSDLYRNELNNDIVMRDLTTAANTPVNKRDFSSAKALVRKIKPDSSIYKKPAENVLEKMENDAISSYKPLAESKKRDGKCGEIDKIANEAYDKGGDRARRAILTVRCERVATPGGGGEKKHPEEKTPPPGGGTVAPPANCDADALKEKGMEMITMGQHAAALAQFEASLRCKRDSYVLQLAFMEACSSGNSGKAKYYFKLLTPAQQNKFAQICIRQKVPYE